MILRPSHPLPTTTPHLHAFPAVPLRIKSSSPTPTAHHLSPYPSSHSSSQAISIYPESKSPCPSQQTSSPLPHPLSSPPIKSPPPSTGFTYVDVPEPITAYDMWTQPQHQQQLLGFGCPIIDEFLMGGLRTGITELVGEAGTGKTQLVCQLVLHAQLPVELGGLNGAAFILSTEGDFPIRRLQQMASAYQQRYEWTATHDYLSNVVIHNVHSLQSQWDIIFNRLSDVIESHHIKLLVIDSIAALFRSEYDVTKLHERMEEQQSLAGQLKLMSDFYQMPILVVNQVTDLFESDGGRPNPNRIWAQMSSGRKVVPTLGLSWSHCVNTRIFLSRHTVYRENAPSITRLDEDGNPCITRPTDVKREMTISFSPYAPSGGRCTYVVEDSGVRGLHFIQPPEHPIPEPEPEPEPDPIHLITSTSSHTAVQHVASSSQMHTNGIHHNHTTTSNGTSSTSIIMSHVHASPPTKAVEFAVPATRSPTLMSSPITSKDTSIPKSPGHSIFTPSATPPLTATPPASFIPTPTYTMPTPEVQSSHQLSHSPSPSSV